MPITTITRDTELSNLDPWGTVADLGAVILQGEARCFGQMTFGAPSDPVSSGYFGTTRATFRMTYPFNEHATVVSGELILTDESTGKARRYTAGDSWFVTKGTPVLWEIVSETFIKHYLAVV
jgi:uncharacterized cupin superfamily protein